MSHGTPSTALDLNAILANAAVTYDADRERHRAADRLIAARDAALAELAARPTRPAGPDDFPAATSLYRQRAEDHAQRLVS